MTKSFNKQEFVVYFMGCPLVSCVPLKEHINILYKVCVNNNFDFSDLIMKDGHGHFYFKYMKGYRETGRKVVN